MKRIIVNVGILLWLFLILVFPLRGSLLHDSLPAFVFAFGNTLKISFPWRFFSPEPASPMSFEYVLYAADESTELARGLYPDSNTKGFNMEFFYRNSYFARNASANDQLLQDLLVPFLCKLRPGTASVLLRRRVSDHPSLARTALYGDADAARATDDQPSQSFACHG